MITPTQLFFRRVGSDWKFQYGVWKSAIDWTVALYIVVPAVLIGLNSYTLLWKYQYGWMEGLSFNWLLIAVYLFAWSETTLSSTLSYRYPQTADTTFSLTITLMPPEAGRTPSKFRTVRFSSINTTMISFGTRSRWTGWAKNWLFDGFKTTRVILYSWAS